MKGYLNTSSRNLNNSHNLSLPPHNPPCKKDHCLLNSLQFNGSIGEKLVLYYVSVFEGIHRYLYYENFRNEIFRNV